jgi:hypothetical protein
MQQRSSASILASSVDGVFNAQMALDDADAYSELISQLLPSDQASLRATSRAWRVGMRQCC